MKAFYSLYTLWFCVFLLLSCSSGEQEGTVAQSTTGETGAAIDTEIVESPSQREGERGEYSLRIRPVTAYANSVFTVYPKNFRLSDGRIEWLVNGKTDPSGGVGEFRPGALYKGDTVQARAILSDAVVESDTLRVMNSPPVIPNAQFPPESFRSGGTLSIEPQVSDIDGDEVTVAYAWTLNNEPAGNAQAIGWELKRGDRVSVTITPYDGEDYGKTVTLERMIQNMSPIIAEDNSFTFDGNVYAFSVSATDPDGDPLTYSLKSAPDGMYINKETGDVTWDVPPDFTGEVPVVVAVSDGMQGESTTELTLRIEEPETERVKINSREE